MPLKIRLKFSNEDVWGFVSGLQLGNLREWDCPGGDTGRTLASTVHLKQRVCGEKRKGSWSPQGQEVLEDERLLEPASIASADSMRCLACW